MEILYERQAIQEYMDEIMNVENTMTYERDMSMNAYTSCQQQYTRLYTRIEEEIRKAQNQLADAESMYRAAAAEYDAAMRQASSADDDSDQSSAQAQADAARQRMADAEVEIARANEALTRANGAMQNLSGVWGQYAPLAETAANRMEDNYVSFAHMTSIGNADLGQYIGLMEQAKGSLYETHATGTGISAGSSMGASNGMSGGGSSSGSAPTVGFSSDRKSVQMNIGGQDHVFPYNKSGMAKAYRTAMKCGDTKMAEHIHRTFSDGNYVEETLFALQQGLEESFGNHMVLAGSEKRKMNRPGEFTEEGKPKGSWQGETYFLDDNYVPEKYNDLGATIGEIKKQLSEKYNLKLEGIPYQKGVADFSGISVANVSTSDIAMRSQGVSAREYEWMSQRERAELYEKAFSDVGDGKSKRERNFHIADQIAAERQIPIVGLEKGYTAKDLETWRSENHFSWDEQVHAGYNLVPTIIHGNVSHTGLVSTAGNANQNIKFYEQDLKQNPSKYSMD